jgi:hypothetical protein
VIEWVTDILQELFSKNNKKKTPWPEVRKRTMPTERPQLVGEVSANFSG